MKQVLFILISVFLIDTAYADFTNLSVDGPLLVMQEDEEADFTQCDDANNLVWLPAEDYTSKYDAVGDSWISDSTSGYQGTGAMITSPDDGTRINTGYAPLGSPRMDYTINFTQTGTHYVWVRGKGQSNGNTAHVGLNNDGPTSGKRVTDQSPYTDYEWLDVLHDGTTRISVNVPDMGSHTFNVWMREDGFIVDEIVLTTSVSYDPEVSGNTCNGEPEIVTEYYATTTGAGGNSGDIGRWSVLPTSESVAMSADNLGSIDNCSEVEDINRIDPNDVVFIKGSGWNNSAYEITIPCAMTLDGWEDTVTPFDPYDPTHQITEPIFYQQARLYVSVDDVTIRDFRFDANSNQNIRVGIDGNRNFTNKAHRIDILNNYFYHDGSSGTQVWIAFANDSQLSNNVSYTTAEGTFAYRRWFSWGGGSRNKIMYNDTTGSIVPMYFPLRRVLGDGLVKAPSSGSYNFDPEFNFRFNQIAYNRINRHQGDQEGFSFDYGAGNQSGAFWERDTVSSVNGLDITLSHADWASSGKDYSGVYAINTTNDVSKYGQYSLIEAQSGATITLANSIGAEAGDLITISHVYLRNWIHNNTADEDDRGFSTSAFLQEAPALENLWEYNVGEERSTAQQAGLKFECPTGGFAAQHFGRPDNTSVTLAPFYGVSAWNIFRNNTLRERMIFLIHRSTSSGNPALWIPIMNNAAYDNTFIDVGDDTGYSLYWQSIWIPVAQRGDVISMDADSSYLSSDPTTAVSDWFAAWPY